MTPTEAQKVMIAVAQGSRSSWTADQLDLWSQAIADLDYGDASAAVRHYLQTVEPRDFSIPSLRKAIDAVAAVRRAATPKLEEPLPSDAERGRVMGALDSLIGDLASRFAMPIRKKARG